MGQHRHQPCPVVAVPAWDLTEGDELPDGHTVMLVTRDAKSRTVRVLTSDLLLATELPADAWVPVIHP